LRREPEDRITVNADSSLSAKRAAFRLPNQPKHIAVLASDAKGNLPSRWSMQQMPDRDRLNLWGDHSDT